MQGSLDVAGPLRNALLALAARRLRNRNPRPESVERAYWTINEYQKDAQRLVMLGYEVSSETVNNPYVEGASFRQRPAVQVRVPIAHVIYALSR